jgi:3-hydroxybutyryl-CoA dehydrogenase
LVEIVRGPQTSQATVDTIRELMLQLGKKPIVISKYLPGFIANRLQSALTQEVFFLLDNGYATVEDIDEAAKNSFALRTPILGLVKRFDFAGLDLTQKILRNRQYAPPPGSSIALPMWTGWWPRGSWALRPAAAFTITATARLRR